jgi:hypothetical protein
MNTRNVPNIYSTMPPKTKRDASPIRAAVSKNGLNLQEFSSQFKEREPLFEDGILERYYYFLNQCKNSEEAFKFALENGWKQYSRWKKQFEQISTEKGEAVYTFWALMIGQRVLLSTPFDFIEISSFTAEKRERIWELLSHNLQIELKDPIVFAKTIGLLTRDQAALILIRNFRPFLQSIEVHELLYYTTIHLLGAYLIRQSAMGNTNQLRLTFVTDPVFLGIQSYVISCIKSKPV